MGTIPSGGMYDLYEALFNIQSKTDKILDLLPDEPVSACTIISCAIDVYFITHGIKPSEGWKMLNDVSGFVHVVNNE